MKKSLILLVTICSLSLICSLHAKPSETNPPSPVFKSFQTLNGTTLSALADGDIFKIAIEQNGVHKLTYDFLKDDLGIDIDNIDPRNIQLFGNGGGRLPETTNDPRYDDLTENPVFISGESDGKFDPSDYIIFHAQGPEVWTYNTTSKTFSGDKSPYDDFSYYFIKIANEPGKRIQSQASNGSPTYTSTTFTDHQRFEENKLNLLNDASGNQGSGQRWFGESFNTTRTKSKSFTFPNLVTDDEVNLKVVMAVRGRISSNFSVEVDGNEYTSSSISSVTFGSVERLYARVATLNQTFPVSSNEVDLSINYNPVGDGTNIAWLDYVEIQASQQLRFSGDQIAFRDVKSVGQTATQFNIEGMSAGVEVWEITDPQNPINQEGVLNGSLFQFTQTTSQLKEFIAFNPSTVSLAPTAIGAIDNQNIHGIEDADMVIIYHPDFEESAQKLAQHRRDFSNLEVYPVNIFHIYNEFSSGAMDPSAIRDFARMLFQRTSRFKYLLLFGDGSFDYRNVYKQASEGNEKNFIPVFETSQSLHPIEAFPSDDYYALLSDGEGGLLKGALDIAVGRLPVRTKVEADNVVDKIIRYETLPDAYRDWRNRITFVADDEDSNIHIRDADRIAVQVDSVHKNFNINKIYFDAYEQESTSGGARYPQAKDALNRDMFRGALVINYLGHGGSSGWAQERVLTINDILSWNNSNQLPLFVTATCSFTGYDEPSITSAGEEAIFNPNGGVIGLFTTTRAVYANSNFRLTKAVFDSIFNLTVQDKTIGEILQISKNSNKLDTTLSNARKFTLIGDPALKLAVPKYGVTTSKINGHDVTSGFVDTLSALEKVTIEGFISDNNGQIMSNFSGKVYPTIYDKRIKVTTLAQDEKSLPMEFEIQRNILFKGAASVNNGRFSFTFVVPKDIDYTYGFGKISYYAENENLLDAAGNFENVMIGGADENGIKDDIGPIVEVFMDSEDFIIGGYTPPNPTLLVKLSDDNGINVAGSSIGHDLSGVLDNNTQNSLVLNDFYEAEQDDYTKGTVRFPLFNLEEGKHHISVKVWDVANNSSEGFTEFVVADSEKDALEHVLNYPNPFTTRTQFQFEYNQVNQPIDVQIQIFTVSGRLVKTIEDQVFHDGGISKLMWDGRDDFGDRLGKGVYVYKVKVRPTENEQLANTTESDFEKLVILK